jgi:hypothetical protein
MPFVKCKSYEIKVNKYKLLVDILSQIKLYFSAENKNHSQLDKKILPLEEETVNEKTLFTIYKSSHIVSICDGGSRCLRKQ